MSTRHATEGSAFRQERYSSSPALDASLNGVLVKNRCATLSDPSEIELVWFIQYQSMRQGGLEKFAADLLAEFPERIATPAMLKSARQEQAVGTYYQQTEDIPETPEDCRVRFLENISALLVRFCLDPSFSPERLEELWTNSFQLSIFRDLRGALLEYMGRWEKRCLTRIAQTEIGKKVIDAMEYSEAERALILIEGVYGTGKTWPSKVWCEARPGKRRYVQCPSSNDNIDFFRTIAEPLGVSNALSMKAHQMRARINDVLQAGHLTFVMDESHYLFPQASTRVALPGRVNWIMTALTNYGVPVVLVATPQFMASRATVERNTFWAGGQLDGRISRYVPLPEELEQSDLAAIARMHLPDGDENSIRALVLYALASKKRLRGIEHGVKAARHVARRAGRDKVSFADIKQAMSENVMPSDSALNQALSRPAKSQSSGSKGRSSKIYASSLSEPEMPISAPHPERDAGAILIVNSDRKNKQSEQASLSTG